MNKHTVPPSGKATVDALADQWCKLLAIAMLKLGQDHIVITKSDIEAIASTGLEKTIVVQELDDGLHIRLMTTEEALALARQNKGGFGKS